MTTNLSMNRRTVLRAGLSLLATASLPAIARSKGFFAQHDLPIGLQVYTLGEAMQKDPESTLARVARIGYRSVELPGVTVEGAAALRAAADKAGVRITSVHVGMMARDMLLTLDSNPEQIAATLKTLGATDVVMPFPPMPPRPKAEPGESPQSAIARGFAQVGADFWTRTAELLNERGAALQRVGLRLGYHNHNVEFAPVGNTTGWDILVERTDPKLVSFEVDAGWVAAAGLDPVAFVKRHGGRLRQMHVKDIGAGTQPNFALSMSSTEVGSGSIDWPQLLPAAYQGGVRQFYVEQEPPFETDRFEAVAKSHSYLTTRV